MLRILKFLMLLAILGAALTVVQAQNAPRLEVGDPPLASLIAISQPDANGLVTITGAAGSVFAGAQVAIRNLYTGDTFYTQAGLTGNFSATLYGAVSTPFWISPAQNIPNALRDQAGSLPGGPGTIVYSPPVSAPNAVAITRILPDGNQSDWSAYPSAQGGASGLWALLNADSLYAAIPGAALPADYARLDLIFSFDDNTYSMIFDPHLPEPALLSRTTPNPAPLDAVAITTGLGDDLELRIARKQINTTDPIIERAVLEAVRFLAADGTEISRIDAKQPIPILTESDGIVRPDDPLPADAQRFTVAGSLAGGSARWTALGRVNSLSLNAGDHLHLSLDVTLNVPDLAAGMAGLSMIGQVDLVQVVNGDGQPGAADLDSNNGWSNILTPSGLAVDNLRGAAALGSAHTPAYQIVRRGDQLIFPLDFDFTLPADLPAGIYVPVLRGFGQVGDGDLFAWATNSPLGTGNAPTPETTRLPLALNIGGIQSGRLLWTLFQDSPSGDGSRGLIASEDRSRYALSNRVRFNAPTYILPPARAGEPIAYPIEPYLLNQMPNAYDHLSAPLIPFFFPGGSLSARITRPDGQVDDLGRVAFIQNQLSTAALDERGLFGTTTPVDTYRLTTLNPGFTSYIFQQYGAYQFNLTGTLEDVFGNQYEGGGTYDVLIAEPLEMQPGALSGAPFEVTDAVHTGLRVLPAVPAQIMVRVRHFPLDGSAPSERVIEGTANAQGYFAGDADVYRFPSPGEYILDYEARYTDSEGRLWAGSLRSAGVVSGNSALLARGQRGVAGADVPQRPAWFNLRQYAPDGAVLNYPYHSGDVVWVADSASSQMRPTLRVYDADGTYSAWLQNALPAYPALNSLITEQEIPAAMLTPADDPYGASLSPERAANQAYTYFSAVTSSVAVRQFVQGGLDGGLSLDWDMDDPLNGQAGAGITGLRPGDTIFLFGGAIIRNEAATVREAAGYAALAVIIDDKADVLGPRVYPPYRGEAGGPNGGALLTLLDRDVNAFFQPTGVVPGSVLMLGDTLAVAGQVAPTLHSKVQVRITAPSGAVREFESTASATGYFYDPAQDFAADEAGVWTVQIQVRHEGRTSAGEIEPPPPTGGILGTPDGAFSVYVLPPDSATLDWNDTRSDVSIPAGIPYNFNFPIPDGWTNVQVYHTVAAPGFVLAQGPLRPSGQSFSFQYNPTNLSKGFTNFEVNGQGDGASASDRVALTFVISGYDASGQLQMRSRTFTVTHDRMMTFG